MAIVKFTKEELDSATLLNPKTSIARGVADVGINALKGTLLGGKMLSDAISANNPVSNVIESGIDGLDNLRSQGAKDQDTINSARMQNAEGSGTAAEVGAAVKNFAESPLDTIAQGAGTVVPALVAQRLGKTASAKNAISTTLGAGMGAGSIKGEVYDAVKQSHLNAGKSEQEADALATEAQSYTGKNADQIALGAGLGALAGGTGVESVAARFGANKVASETGEFAAKDLLKSTLTGAAKEAIPEAIQGGQERLASNLAQQRDGFDVGTWTGVAGNAALEGLASAPLGGGFSAAEYVANTRQKLAQTLASSGGGAITEAAQTSVLNGASDAVLSLPAPTTDNTLVVFPDGSTMTRAEAEQIYSAEELAAFQARTNTAPKKAETLALPAPTFVTDANGNTASTQFAMDELKKTLGQNSLNKDSRFKQEVSNVSNTPNATTAVATGAAQPSSDNTQGGVGDLSNQPNVSGLGDTAGALAQSKPSNVATGTASDANSTLNRPFASATDDILPKLRGMTTDAKVISQIDAELKLRGLANDVKANDAATSVSNDLPEPTDAQKEAGNYKKGAIKISGLNISVENPHESVRKGVDKTGAAWESKQNGHYGYIKGVVARAPDKEHVDVNIKQGTSEDYAGDVYVINQNDPTTGKFDEPKVYIGYTSQAEAKNAYHMNYAKGWKGFGSMSQVSMAKFKEMLNDENAFKNPIGNLSDAQNNQDVAQTDEETPKAPKENKKDDAESADNTEARNAVESIVKRRAAANQIGKGKAFDTYLAQAKKMLAGEVIPKNTFKLAKNAFKADAELAKQFDKLDAIINKSVTDSRQSTKQLVEGIKAEIAAATDSDTLDEIKARIVKLPVSDNIAIELDDTLMAKYDELLDSPKSKAKEDTKNKLEKVKDDAAKVKAHTRDFERLLFNTAAGLDVDNVNDVAGFAAKHNKVLVDAITGMKKDADALQGKSLDAMVVDGKLKVSDAFWKNAYKEAQKAAGIDPSKKRKLENTGIVLRRYWQLNKANVDKADGWKAIEKSTARANAFKPIMPEDAEASLVRYVDIFRNKAVKTFADWLEDGAMSRTYGRVGKGMIQTINYYLDGETYIPSQGQGASKEERLQLIKDEANAYLNQINRFNEALSGAKTIDEFTAKYEKLTKSVDVDGIPDYLELKQERGYDIYSSKEEAPVSLRAYKYKDEDIGKFNSRVIADLNTLLRRKEFNGIKRDNNIDEWFSNGLAKRYAVRDAEKDAPSRKDALSRPRLDKVTRNGRKDYRNGKDITPLELKTTFGLADVGFGQYVNAVQDQKHINFAYDAFKDLANILGLPDKAIGLGGKLHFTVGALGHGKAAAVYIDNQPKSDGSGTVHVINLTNTRGDGTVAHEWMHALDYHIMHNDKSGYTEAVNAVRDLLRKKYDFSNVIPRVKQFLRGQMYYPRMRKTHTAQEQAIYYLKHGSAAKAQRTKFKIDADKLGEDYWGNEREVWARAGEAYVYDQFNGTTSDYLVTDWVADGKVTEEKYRGTPYPTGDERKAFNAGFKLFFDSLKVTDEGVSVDVAKFKKQFKSEKAEFDAKVQDLIDNLPRYINDWKEEERKAKENPRDMETEALIAEQKRIEEARMQAEIAAAMNANNKTEPLTDDDLESIFDEAAAELREQAAEQPDTVVGEPQASKTVYKDKEIVAPKKTAPSGNQTQQDKTAAKLVAEAAKLGVKGIDEALTGLTKLFGGGNGRMNSFPSGFDEDAYKDAKPHFEAALKAFVDAGKTLKDLFKFLIQNLGEGVKPYAIQFAKENQLGAQLGNEGAKGNESTESGSDNPRGDEAESAENVRESAGGFSDSGSGIGDGGFNAGRDSDSGAPLSENESEPETGSDGMAAPLDNRGGDSQQYGVRGKQLATNFVIPQGGLTRQGSWRETAMRNFDVIELVKRLDREQRPATKEEQSLLSKYTGFGASEIRNNLFPSNAFSGGIYRPSWVSSAWGDVAKRAKDLLSDDELKSLLSSTQYAHFTPEGITRGIWAALGQFGFKGGNVIEPAMGSGNFAGTMPVEVGKISNYTGIEYDVMTASIAKYLYPESNVIEGDYIETKMPNNYFDVAISNPPFSDTVIKSDRDYKKFGFVLHDYFFAKTIDKVREGGLLVFVTSKGTMDKNSSRARQYLADRADLVGAVRFPQTAFKEQAGTEVVTDVIILRKRAAGEAPSGNAWTELKEIETPQGKTLINEYFVDNPKMVLGTAELGFDRFGKRSYTVIPKEGSNLEADFNKAIASLPSNIYSDAKASPAVRNRVAKERDMNPKSKKEGGLYIDDKGNLMIVDNGIGVDASEYYNIKGKDVEYLKDYVALRDALKLARYDQWNEGNWEASLKALNKQYDAFVKKHGNIKEYTTYLKKEVNEDGEEVSVEAKRFKKWRLIKRDAEGTIVWALEDIKEDGSIVKAAALNGRVVKKPTRPVIETAQDALAVALDEQGSLDLDKVAELAGMTKDKVIAELGDLIFELPSGQWQMRDEYLSGYVIDKLEEAEQAAKLDKRFERNVQALLLVQPKPLSASNTTVALGSTWVPDDVVMQFSADVLDINMDIRYNEALSKWEVEGSRSTSNRNRTTGWGTTDKSAHEILEAVLNGKSIEVIDRTGETPVKDQDATAAVNELMKKMASSFKSWVWTDAQRAERLMAIYNRKFNNIADRQFDGSHLTLSGVSSRFKLHPHQKRAIWRIIQTGNTYLAHAVGAGKTYEMIAAGMEQRRLGLIRRPMYVVPNHMLEQFASEFIDLYPTANIMVADKDNFGKQERQRFTAQAAVNDPDAIIITHSAFGLVSLRAENYDNIIEEQLDELRIKLEDTKDDRASRSQIESQIKKLEQRLKGKVDAEAKDDNINFEDMGVDFVFLDEAHEFRKLDFATNRTKVKGINPTGSARAIDLYTKIRYLETVSPNRSHVFASGTPITNTMGELYTVMRFFAENEMKADGLNDFDAWAAMFGEVAADFEANSAGKYELVERFSTFINVPELMKRIRRFMDVLTSSSLGTLVVRPNIVGGQRKIIVTPQPQNLKEYMRDELTPRIEASKKWKPSPSQPNNPDPIIAIIGDARLANIDMRFINPSLPSDPDSKLNQMIDGMIEVYHRTKDVKYFDKEGNQEPLLGATQIVFANVGFGDAVAKNRGFSARDWVNKRLKEAGVKSNEVAWMADYDTDQKKHAMFKEMKRGSKRILIGSPKNMGTGTNVQDRLIALQYLDPPWYPSDLEQPEGRIIRQGNKNEEVELYAYATKGSYDSTMWQMVARKGRFIEQAFSGDDSVRSLSDISESSQYQMAAAMASGDSRVIELAGLEASIVKYTRLRDAHATQQRDLRYKINMVDATIRSNKERLAQYDEAISKVGSGLYGDIKFNVGNEVFKERAEFGEAVIKAYDATKNTVVDYNDRLEVAKVGDYPVFAVMGALEKRLVVKITDDVEFTVDSGSSLADKDPSGLTTRLVNQVNRISTMRSGVQDTLDQNERERKAILSKIGAPYEYEQDLNEAIAAAATLKQELAQTGDEANIVAPVVEDDQSADVATNDDAANRPELSGDYALAIRLKDTFRYVQAEKLTDAEFAGLDLYIHKSIDNDAKMVVTEASTGVSLVSGEIGDSKQGVIKRAKDVIQVQGMEKINSLIFRTPKSDKQVMDWNEYQNQSGAVFSRSQRKDLVPKSELDALAGIFKALETDVPMRKLIANRAVEKHPMANEIKRIERDFYDTIGALEEDGRLKINCKD